jgi:hypothetical protein
MARVWTAADLNSTAPQYIGYAGITNSPYKEHDEARRCVMKETRTHLTDDPLTSLAERMRALFPDVNILTDELPSGNIFLNFDLGERFVVLEYVSAKQLFGVSNVTSPHEGFVGHDDVYPRLEDAERRIVKLLSQAEN